MRYTRTGTGTHIRMPSGPRLAGCNRFRAHSAALRLILLDLLMARRSCCLQRCNHNSSKWHKHGTSLGTVCYFWWRTSHSVPPSFRRERERERENPRDIASCRRCHSTRPPAMVNISRHTLCNHKSISVCFDVCRRLRDYRSHRQYVDELLMCIFRFILLTGYEL